MEPLDLPEPVEALLDGAVHMGMAEHLDEPEARCSGGEWLLNVEAGSEVVEVVAFGWDVGGDGGLTGAAHLTLDETFGEWSARATEEALGRTCEDPLVLVGFVGLTDEGETGRAVFTPALPMATVTVHGGYAAAGGELTLELSGGGGDAGQVWVLEPLAGHQSGPLTLVDRGQGRMSGTWSLSAVSESEDIGQLWLGFAAFGGGALLAVDGT